MQTQLYQDQDWSLFYNDANGERVYFGEAYIGQDTTALSIKPSDNPAVTQLTLSTTGKDANGYLTLPTGKYWHYVKTDFS